MSKLTIEPSVHEQLSSFQLPDELGFGITMLPIMVECDYANGEWGEMKVVPYRQLTFDPTAKVLHYGQEIFEGMKAYRYNGTGPYLFRPTENIKRFNLSAKRMAMPVMDEALVLEGIKKITELGKDFIPTESEASLYIRPFMIATDIHLGMKPSETFKFMIVASPSKAYFKSSEVKVYVETEMIRAGQGGIGSAKTGGNYAASLLSMIQAKDKGFDQVLWLDGKDFKNIEEMSGMNFFAVYGNKVVCPKLTNTILNGVTRKSVLELARHLGYDVEERTMDYRDLLLDIKSGSCTECFACGTAVIITPLSALGTDDYTYELPKTHEVTMRLRDELLGIQQGTSEDPFGWRITV